MGSGTVYVVHNNWIQNPDAEKGCKTYKIGITTKSVGTRYYGLDLKMPSEFACDFAYKFDNEQYKEVEQKLHKFLNQLNVGGEWYDLNDDTLEVVHDVCKQNGGELITDDFEKEIAGEKKQRRRPTKVKKQPKETETSKTTFKKLGIKVGTELVYKNNEAIKVKTVDEKNNVKYKGKTFTISNVSFQLMGYNTNGYKYFKYNGKVLDDIKRKKYPN